MTMKAFKYRIFPTAKQKEEILLNINCSKFVFNFFLATQKRKEEMWHIVEEMVQQGYFEENNWKGKCFNVFESKNALTELKKNQQAYSEFNSEQICSILPPVKKQRLSTTNTFEGTTEKRGNALISD